ncbi:hypothetical protein [Gilliamella sp. ESL0250]|uniref:hypothetical protein n=1 Tax=Gilliamella sp. ESL0250 TaxID=2705036 RepID=UPI00158090F1|nr:hypothetical protein [Gilliamella sp. ESL0250]NUF48337.1 hypothetical protein [Gilliamella sp. ESL0250]
MSSLWHSQALASKNGRVVNNRSDAIVLSPSPFINFARPNLVYGTRENAGPAGIWHPKKGFFTQSINPSSYALNFPTTGANGLYFDLDIEGVDASELTWEPVTHEGITATVTQKATSHYEDDWLDGPEDVTRVILTGPRVNDDDVDENGNYLEISQHPTYLGLVGKPNLPQTFELVGKDKEGNVVVTYGFVLQKWFLLRNSVWNYNAPTHAEWCDGLGYRLPKVKDLTNAFCRGFDRHECQGAVGATPSSKGNYYQRQIGAGFFTEWGAMYHYTEGSDFGNDGHPVSDPTGDNTYFAVTTFDGQVLRNPAYIDYEGLCVTP